MFNKGGIISIGPLLNAAFDKTISTINSLKPNVEALWSSLVKFTQISGLDKVWNSLNPGTAFDTIQAALKNALNGFNGIVDFVNNNFGAVKTAVEAAAIGVTAYGIAIAAVTVKQKAALVIEALSKAWWVATGIIGAMRNGMTLAAIAQDALNIAMAANPIGLITIAIAALIGVGVLLYKNWDTISVFFGKVWGNVKTTFINFWNWIKSFLSQWGTVILAVVAPFIGIPVLIVQHWSQIKAGLSAIWTSLKASVSSAWTSIKNTISNIWKSIVTVITNSPLFKVVSAIFKGILAIVIVVGYNIYKGLSSVWNSVYTTVKGVLTSIWATITSIWNKIYTTISNVVTKVLNVIVTVWSNIYSTVSAILNSVWNVIVTIWNTIYNSISAVVKSIWTTIVTIWNSVYSSVSSVVTSIWTTIVTGFTNAYNSIVSIFGNIKNTVSTIFMDIWNVIKSVINSGIGMINGFIGGVNSVIDVANKVPGVNIGTVGTITQLANGGYIKHRPGGILANIGEGNEDEIVSPVSKLKNIINSGSTSQQQQANISYSPQIIIQGNASKDDVVQALSISKAQFKQLMDDYNSGKGRLSFNQG
jgi:phage-related protein